MFKKLLCSLLPVLFLLSCSGLFWEGENEDSITVSITNPFYNPSTSETGRALALQGNFLYIEIALIEDQAVYDADSTKATTGNGEWMTTGWGGHAIVALSVSDSDKTFDATFIDVPREQNLLARAVLETNEQALITGLNGAYRSGTEPVCQTFIASGANPEEKQWVTLTIEDLATNLITMPMRPVTPETLVWGNHNIEDDYLSAAQTIPSIGETRFFTVGPDLATLMVRDVGYYSLVSGLVDFDGAPPASLSILHDSDGTPFEVPAATYQISDPYDYKQLQIETVSLPDYTSPDYLLSTSLLLDPMSFSWWTISFGVLYDLTVEAGPFNTEFEASWSIPPGFSETDLEFKMIYFDSTALQSSDLDTVEKVMNQTITREWAWNEVSWNGTKFFYSETGYSVVIDAWGVILARRPGGETFIYGKTRLIDLLMA